LKIAKLRVSFFLMRLRRVAEFCNFPYFGCQSKHPNMKPSNQGSLSRAYFWLIISYLCACALGYWAGAVAYSQTGGHLITAVAVAGVVATVVVFAFSLRFDNSSFYDPYWSVIPIFIAVFILVWGWDSGADHFRSIAAMLLVLWWGARLTWNWARNWRGLSHQDWRYVDLQQKNGRAYWVVSFLGIHLMPTVLVFLGCLPLFTIMSEPGKPVHFLDIAGFMLASSAILLEATADNQLNRYVKNPNRPAGKTFTGGVWGMSRHPNYLGEVSFWWGLAIMGLAAQPAQWWVVAGAVCITALFQFISIPMMEKHMLARRADYAEVQKRVPRFLPTGRTVSNGPTGKED
jgi:steroid 5-alpha reductase family enzyme